MQPVLISRLDMDERIDPLELRTLSNLEVDLLLKRDVASLAIYLRIVSLSKSSSQLFITCHSTWKKLLNTYIKYAHTY